MKIQITSFVVRKWWENQPRGQRNWYLRGCRDQYIAGMNHESLEAMRNQKGKYEVDLFSEDTIEEGNTFG